jgi:hypothetical protein
MPVYELDGYRYEIDETKLKYRLVSDGDPAEFVDWLAFEAFEPLEEGFRLLRNGIYVNVTAPIQV